MITCFIVLVVGMLHWPNGMTCQQVESAQGGAFVRVTVFDTGYGTIVQGATVKFHSTKLEVSAQSDKAGSYSIENIPPDQYTITVSCPGFATHHSEATFGRGSIALDIPIDVGLQGNSGLLLEGTVTGPDKSILQGATVIVASPFDSKFLERTRTQQDGRYKVTVPRPGQYVVYASKEGHKAVAVVISADSERTESDFTLPVFHF